MLTLKSVVEIDSSHYLKNYEGKCANLHGHRWRIEVELQGTSTDLDKAGMLCDFGLIKNFLRMYDHALFLFEPTEEEKDFFFKRFERVFVLDFNSTAENLAEYWAEEIMLLLIHKGLTVKLKSLTVYETPENSITYKV